MVFEMGEEKSWIHKLGIAIVTYNRAPFLNRTFVQLAKTPFRECEIVVLNNSSTDNTLDIIRKWHNEGLKLRVITHSVNIGASANILRAVELLTQEYILILGDDDIIKTEGWDDVLQALREAKADVIRLGYRVLEHEKGKLLSIYQILSCENYFWSSVSFITSVIFRRRLFMDIMQDCYRWIYFDYPHLRAAAKLLETNGTVYTASRSLVERDPHPVSQYVPMPYLLKWLGACSCIRDKKIRKAAISALWKRPGTNELMYFIKSYLIELAIMKAKNIRSEPSFASTTGLCILNLVGFQKIVPIVLFPFIILIDILPGKLFTEIYRVLRLNKHK